MRSGSNWIDQPQPTGGVGVRHSSEGHIAKGAHRLPLEPAEAFFRHHDHDFRAIGLGQPRGQCAGERVVGEVLVFDVDQPLRARD